MKTDALAEQRTEGIFFGPVGFADLRKGFQRKPWSSLNLEASLPGKLFN